MTSLVKKIDDKVHAAASKHPRRLGTFVIIGDAPGRTEQLKSIALQDSLQRVTLCIGAAPPRYEVNKDADVTVVVYTVGRPRQNVVVANFALRTSELDETQCDAILAALSKVLPK